MIDWLRVVINYCTSILTTQINVGSGYSISIWNVFVFGIIGFLILKLVFSLLD